MSNDFNLKQLWQQPTPPPTPVEAILNRAQHFKRKQTVQLLVSSALLFITGIVIGWIVWYFQPELWTTKLGVLLVLIALALVIGFQSRLLPLLLRDNSDLDNKSYLAWLEQVGIQKIRLQTSVISLYFLLLSAGIGCYLYEYTLKMSPIWAISCYGLTAAWIAFNWWYLRPRIVQKHQTEFETLREELDSLKTQWEEDGEA